MKTNHRIIQGLALLTLLNFSPQLSTFAQGTTFTYQGRLNDGANPANGIYDLRFTICDSATNGSVVAGPLTNSAIAASNGLFTTALDFGADVFTGDARWLEIGVRAGTNDFTTLSPRQPITPMPYALYSASAGTAGGASNVLGVLPGSQLSGTYSNAVNFNNPGNNYSGSGAGLTNVNANSLNGQPAGAFWQLAGNAINPGDFLGTLNDQPLEFKVNGLRALRLERPGYQPNVIGGDGANSAGPGVVGATIAGGGYASGPNTVNAEYGFIGGGHENTIQTAAGSSTIGGGARNTIQTNGNCSTIGGGYANSIETNTMSAVIGGGQGNTIQSSATHSTLSGGYANIIESLNWASTIAGGAENVLQTNASCSGIAGGYHNVIESSIFAASIAGGQENTIQMSATHAAIGGGYLNTIETNAGNSTISGGQANVVKVYADFAVIGGGAYNTNAGDFATVAGGNQNKATAPYATVGGGAHNRSTGGSAVVAGGYDNSADAGTAAIGGGEGNAISPGTWFSVIAGGGYNFIGTNAYTAAIGGGNLNSVLNYMGTIAGGYGNTNSGAIATIGGGYMNTASGGSAVVAGGFQNLASGDQEAVVSGGYQNQATANYAAVGGGAHNQSTAWGAVVPGGTENLASGDFSSASGHRAKAVHTGTFVWADSFEEDFSSTVSNQFLIRASGGVGINTNNPVSALHVAGVVTASGFAGDGSGIANLNAANLNSGTLPSSLLSGTYSNAVNFSNTDNVFTGDGAGLANLNASALATGVLPSGRLSGTYSSQVNFSNPSNTFKGTFTGTHHGVFVGDGSGMTNFSYTFTGTNFMGNGSFLTDLDAGNINHGTLADGCLSSNVVMQGNIVNFSNVTVGGESVSEVIISNGNIVATGNIVASNNVVANGDVQANGNVMAAGDVIARRLMVGHFHSLNGSLSSIVGGNWNNIEIWADYSVICGGTGNFLREHADWSVIGGGGGNKIDYDSDYGAIGGGLANVIGTNSLYGAIGGGEANTIGADSPYCTIGGGDGNSIKASADTATIPGGANNEAGGDYSFAAGYYAHALHDRTFVWSDGYKGNYQNKTDFGSTAPYQFLIHALGGVGINTNNPAGAALNVAGTVIATAFVGDGSGLTGIVGGGTSSNHVHDASAITSGTLADARLSINVALLNSSQTFSGTLTANGLIVSGDGKAGIGVALPQEKLEVAGAVVIGNNIGTPKAGTIRWSGSDFEGYNGTNWVSLTLPPLPFMEFVTVDHPGNVPDSTGWGAVNYSYRIGKYEVNNTQYATFLNAVAASDPFRLWNGFMKFDYPEGELGIHRSGSDGSYTYSVAPDCGNKPVVNLTYYSAVRFCNWMHNGRPRGTENQYTTENGAYAITGNQVGARNADAKFWVPNRDEWHKAAYYQPVNCGGPDPSGYWWYPTRSNGTPHHEPPPSGTNSANYANNSTLLGLTDIGAYIYSPSYYGTFDQGGNAWEWNEHIPSSEPPYLPDTVIRGGSSGTSVEKLNKTYYRKLSPGAESDDNVGFRIASALE